MPKYEVFVSAHCYKTVVAITEEEAEAMALLLVEDGDFEIDGVDIIDFYLEEE